MLQILKMVALDFYSHQTDRTAPNINFQVLPTISLAPLFDYSETFDIENKLEGANQYSYIRNRYYFDNKNIYYENNLFKNDISKQKKWKKCLMNILNFMKI